MWILAMVLATGALQQAVGGILIERRLAEDLPAAVGDTVWAAAVAGAAGQRPFQVEGIFERAADPSRISRNDYEVRFHLPELEALMPIGDRVDRIAVALEPGFDPGSAVRWVEPLAYGTQVVLTEQVTEEASTTFRVISRFHEAIGLVTLGASGLFLLCLMIVGVDQRRGDVRTMRLVGISRATVVKVILLEAAVVAGSASVLGVGLGLMMSAAVNGYYGSYYDTTLSFAIVTPRIVAIALALGAGLGLAAGVMAAYRIGSVPPQRLGER
jgi:putative ABC transport system permease protein